MLKYQQPAKMHTQLARAVSVNISVVEKEVSCPNDQHKTAAMVSPITDVAQRNVLSFFIKLLQIAVNVQNSTHKKNVNSISKARIIGYSITAELKSLSVFP
jgi:hypothetical protein